MTSAMTRNQRRSASQSSSSGAEVLVKQLESYGVDVVFGLCGHTNITVLDALSRSRIHFVTTRHEQGTAHMADGYARMTGKPGVVLTVTVRWAEAPRSFCVASSSSPSTDCTTW